MSTRTIKKLLLSLIAIGILASFTTGGVYAVFVTESQNPSVVGTGTFIMSNTVAGSTGTTCTSDPGTNNSNTTTCDKIVTSTSLAQAHLPGALTTVTVDIKNTGTIDATDLSVSMPGATAGAGCTFAANAFVPVANQGGGNPCGSTGDLFYIQENDGSGSPIRCWYPAGAGACSISGGGTLYNFSNNYYFNGPNLAPKLDLGTDGSTVHGLAAGSTRHFVIGIQEGTDNTLQGETATFSLLWHLDSSA